MRKFWHGHRLRAGGRAAHARHHGNRLGRKPRRHAEHDLRRRRSARSPTSSAATYKRDKFRTRIERGTEPGTVDIYISHRGAEQVPTTHDRQPLAGGVRVGGRCRPIPASKPRCWTRLMVRFGTPTQTAAAAVQAVGRRRRGPERARSRRTPSGSYQLVVDDSFDRAWRRVGLALDRVGFTVVDRDRSKGTYFVRYADPETTARRRTRDSSTSSCSGRPTTRTSEQYRITVAEADPRSLVTVQDPNGAPDKSATGEKILVAPRGPAQVARAARMRFASLGSGSEGNGLVVEAGGTRILIDCGFGVRGTAARLRAARPRARRRSPRSSSRTSTPIISAACRRSPRATAFRSGRRSARSPWSPSASRACRTSTASTATSGSRSARSRSRRFAVPHDAREPVQYVDRRRRAARRRADRPRRVDGACRGVPVRLRRAGARMQSRSRHARERRLSAVAQAADRGRLRPSAQRGGGGDCWRASTRRGSRTSSPRIFRSRTTRRSSRARALAAALGCRARLDRHRRTRRRDSTGAI